MAGSRTLYGGAADGAEGRRTRSFLIMKKLIASAVLIVMVAALVYAFISGRKERATEAERESPVKAQSRVSVEQDETIISIDPQTQQRSNITTVTLEATAHQGEQRAYAQVLEMRAWSEARNTYLVAKGQSNKTVAAAEESRTDVVRQKALHTAGSTSAEAMYEADIKARASQADLQPAQAAVRLLESSMRETWGGPLADWLMNGSPQLDELVNERSVLIQISLPAAVSISEPPPTAMVRGADGKSIPAQFVSRTARVDPRFQGGILFYMAPRQERGLFPGLATTAFLPHGEPQNGVIVGTDAVVWWQGRPWVYVQIDPQRFARRELPSDAPVPDGWFVSKGIKGGDRIVNKGAQQLLSEEFRSQIQVGEDKK